MIEPVNYIEISKYAVDHLLYTKTNKRTAFSQEGPEDNRSSSIEEVSKMTKKIW